NSEPSGVSFPYPRANVALKGEAVQSSTLFPSGANRAIDGKRHTFYTEGSCSHTAVHETAPGGEWTCTRCLSSPRLDGAEIRIGNSLDNNGNDNPRCATITHIPRGNTFTFTCQSGSMEGRYVNVVIPGDNKILTLCEVEVYADPTGDAATLTL
uniref:Fucolectin tachylectin-4 pentraxin-1 domain-containing protein n=1 Tax=Neogobius melanostomus TaxID=47308 RepID=A0A8C6SHB0_9GOBI